VSALDRSIDATTPFGMLQHDAPLNPGSSGGPVIDEDGFVVGINTAMPDGFRRDVGIAYAIPAAVAEPIVGRLATGSTPAVRRLGVSLRALSPRLAAAVGLLSDSGVLVEAVDAGSDGAVAGLLAADVIVKIGAREVGTLRDVAVALDEAPADGGLDVAITRGAEHLILSLPPAEVDTGNVAPETRTEPRHWVDASSLGLALATTGTAQVLEVVEGGPADKAGIAAGDTILAVGRTRTDSTGRAAQLIGAVVTEPFALLLADAAGQTRYVVVDPWAPGLDGDGLGGNMRHPRSARF